MKAKFCKIYKILILFTLIFSLFSCNNSILDLSESEYGNVSFSINGYDSSSRTIIPMSADKENLFFTLTGAIGESVETVLKTTNDVPVDKMAYSDFKDASFRLSSGKWHFTLTGYDSNSESAVKLISGKAVDVKIGEGKNSVTFDMTPEAGGVGSISVVLNYNLGSDTESKITEVQAILSTIDDSADFIAVWPSEDPKPELSVTAPDASEGMIVYNKKDVTSGTYLLTFTVTTKNSVNNQTCVGYRSDVVIVATGSESFDESTIELNQKYSISYKNKDGTDITWEDDYTPPSYYDSYTTTTLPVASNIKNTNASFIGWFTADGLPKTKTDLWMSGPTTYFAHWQDSNLYVSKNGSNSDTTTGNQDDPYATVDWALSIIYKASSSNLDWQIIVEDEITENVTITPQNASSITISGLKPNSASSISGTTSTITVSAPDSDSTIPVIITNITINGGNGTQFDGKYSGGALFVNKARSYVKLLENAVITNGKAAVGGGVYVSNGTVDLEGGSITSNGSATTITGGGVYVASSGKLIINSGTISTNTADNGGGIYNAGGTVTMTGGTLDSNQAIGSNSYGGGIYNAATGSFTMSAGEIINNKAVNGEAKGGGIYNSETSTLILSGIALIGSDSIPSPTKSNCSNYAKLVGGGIYNAGTMTLEGSYKVSGNYASSKAGGVYTKGALDDSKTTNIINNKAHLEDDEEETLHNYVENGTL